MSTQQPTVTQPSDEQTDDRTVSRRNFHCFLTHKFIDAIVNDRQPVNDLYEALAYTAPGIVAHESALRDGELMKIPSFDR
jgi:hypothetical protein